MSTTAGPLAAASAAATEKPSRSGSCTSSSTASGSVGRDRREGFRRVRRLAGDDVPGALEQLPRDRAKRLMVVDDQHPLRHVAIVAHASGRRSGFSLESRRSRWKPRPAVG